MLLAAGTQLGSYSIVGLLGAGGMGEVYRARDTRLGRDVALKTLPDRLTQDPDRLARFRREAQVLAALNHQHIAGIYGLEETDRHRFLVLEFVDGETLASRIERGALPIDEALTIARQIAEALEAAHERGIVHRDLKPANIALTSSDRVKVLDFGLAKAADTSPASTAAAPQNPPTITSPAMLTEAGMILGTSAYMSPEQARGRAADKRSDVWAFGGVLFEMLTGRRAFDGDDVGDTLAAVLRSDPPWDALPATLPSPIRALLKGCLEKKHDDRISDISTALFVLKQPPSLGLAASPQSAASAWPRAWPVAALLAAGAALGAGAAVGLWPRASAPSAPDARVARFELPMTDGQVLTLARRAVAVSPDGSHIAYAAGNRIFIRPIAEPEARPLAGADPGVLPTFSPDGLSLVFWANAELKRVSIAGGAPVSLVATKPGPFALAWDASGIIFDRQGTGILRVSPDGGTPQPIVPFNDRDGLVQRVQLLPDGDTVLFSITRTDGLASGEIVVQSIRTGERKTVIERGLDAHYLPTGHLVYLVGATLMARPFDVNRKEVTGGPVPVIEGVRRAGGANFAVSDNGVLAYSPAPAQLGQDLMLYDRQDKVTALKVPPAAYQHPRVSPDGQWLAVETYDGKEAAISIYELSGASSIRRLTYGSNNRAPVWSSDGQHVAFQSDRDGDRAVFWQPVDGGPATRLTRPEPGTVHTPESWSPSGDVLLFSATRDADTTLWTYSTGNRAASRFGDIVSVGVPTDAVFSPDGRWVAYQIGEATSTEGWTYVEPFPPTGTKHQIARGGRPAWHQKGEVLELFFVPAPGQFQAVTIRSQPTFAWSNPFNVPRRFVLAFPTNPRPYDVLPDGRVVTVGDASAAREQGAPQIQVVLNWFEEVKRKLAAASGR